MQHRKVFTLKEQEISELESDDILVDGKLNIYPEVLNKDYFQISAKGQVLKIQSRSYVGLIPINDNVAIDVRPRVPIANLAYLLQATRLMPQYLSYTKDYAFVDEQFPSLVNYMADAYIDALTRLQAERRQYEYQQIEEVGSLPKGRILLGPTVKRYLSRGNPYTVVTATFQRLSDTLLNRCLKYATWYLAQIYLRMPTTPSITSRLARLNALYLDFSDVKLDHARAFLHRDISDTIRRVPPYYEHYVRPVSIATAIIRNQGVALQSSGEEISLGSFLLKMDDIFEEYVRGALQRLLPRLNPSLQVLDGNNKMPSGGKTFMFDDTESTTATPDIVVAEVGPVSRENLSTKVIIDVKYKPLKGKPNREDINQIVSYAYTYRSPAAAIVSPLKDSAQPRVNVLGKIQETTFFTVGIDLSKSDMGQEENLLSETIRSIVMSGPE